MTPGDGGRLLRDPRQILYDLIPLGDEASVLELFVEDGQLFRPDSTRFRNVERHALALSRSDHPGDLISEVAGPGQGRHDLIVLHDALPRLLWGRRGRELSETLAIISRRLFDALNENGVLAVCFENRYSLGGLLATLGGMLSANVAARNGRHGGLTNRSVSSALEEAGFRHIDAFAVTPDCHCPKRLISLREAPSRDYYAGEYFRVIEQVAGAKQAIYWLLFKTGFIRKLEPSYLLWAQK